MDVSLGPLEEVVRDPAITDVAVTCDGRVWADRGMGMREYLPKVPFHEPSVVREYAVQLCAQLGRRLDDAQPMADASSVEGVRVHAVIAPLVPQGAAISIRFPDRTGLTLRDLGTHGMFPATWLPLLLGLVRRKATLLVTGGTGSGKTSCSRLCSLKRTPSIASSPSRRCGSWGNWDMATMSRWLPARPTSRAGARWVCLNWSRRRSG